MAKARSMPAILPPPENAPLQRPDAYRLLTLLIHVGIVGAIAIAFGHGSRSSRLSPTYIPLAEVPIHDAFTMGVGAVLGWLVQGGAAISRSRTIGRCGLAPGLILD